MKAGHILSAGLLSVWVFGCNQATEPAQRQVDGRTIAPAVNALSKVAAVHAGYGMSREVANDPSVNPFDSAVAQSLQQIGVCDNFVQLIQEILNAGSTANEQTLMNSPRFQKVVTCFESEANNLTGTEAPEALLPIFDKCFCDGSGTVFGAIAAYAFGKYQAPHFNGYSAPISARGYSSPSVAPGYSSPSAAPGYSAPSL